MKEIFENYIEHSFDENRQAAFRLIQFENNYRNFFPFNKDAAIADIGIGRGEMLSCMKSWGYRNYRGVDISPSTVQFCQALDLNCSLIQDTKLWLDEHIDTFELITLLDVLEHIHKRDTVPLLKAFRASLIKGGVLIIQVPNMQAPDGHLHRYNDITHEVGYVEHSLRQVLLSAGFTNFEFHGFEDSISTGFRPFVRKILRSLYWKYVRACRVINGNMNPEILSPVFFAVIRK